MKTLGRRTRKLRMNTSFGDYQGGGFSIDQFQTDNLRPGQLRRLRRRIDRANSGNNRQQRKLQELLNMQNIFGLRDQGYQVAPMGGSGNSFRITDPNGNAQTVNAREPGGFNLNNIVGSAISGVSNFVPGLGVVGNIIGQGMQGNINFGQQPVGAQQFMQGMGQQPAMGGFPSMMGGMGMSQFGMGNPFGGGMMGLGQNPLGGIMSVLPAMAGIGSLLGNIASGGQGMTSPGFAGGQFGFKKGGRVRKFQSGGVVDIQAEKGELILHPTGFLTPVHAKKSHKKMERSGDGDAITDHPLEGSFIFSDFLKIKKSDADDLIVGVKRYPYKEGKKGKEPEVHSVGDLFRKREKKKTPAELAKRVSSVFKVTNDTKDIFNMMGDQLNIQNRAPYLQGIAALSEVEREADDAREMIGEMSEMIVAKKGGTMRSRRVYRPIRSRMAQQGGIAMQGTLPPAMVTALDGRLDGFPAPLPFGPVVSNNPYNPFGNMTINPPLIPGILGVSPRTPPPLPTLSNSRFGNMTIPTPPIFPNSNSSGASAIGAGAGSAASSIGTGIGNVLGAIGAGAGNPGADTAGGAGVPQFPQGQMMTQFVDQGSPLLRQFGNLAIPIGAGLTFGSNIAGAIGSYDMNNRFIDENRDFFGGQRALVNRSRDIATTGNLFDVGLNLLQQGPVDQEERFSSRVRQFDPNEGVRVARQMGDQSIGQINSMIRNNPNMRAANLGSAIAANNASVAQATQDAMGRRFQIDQYLDEEDFYNQGVRVGNQQRRVDFGNSIIQGMRPGFAGVFTNESSRPLDILGLNSAERQADIAFRQNRLFQPIQFLSTAGNSLANAGASAITLGTNYVPQQVMVNPSGTTGNMNNGFANIVGGIGNIANLIGGFSGGTLGGGAASGIGAGIGSIANVIGGGKKGGRVKRYKK
jgi:hypothetical protein